MNKNLYFTQVITAISGGILMGLTPAPVQAWPLAWIALVPLWFLVATAKSVKRSSFYGLLWGIGYHGLALSWITGIHPMDWMGVPWLLSIAIALFCWTFITLWGAILVALWAAGMTFLNNLKFVLKKSQFNSAFSALTRVLIGTTLWCLLEAIWSAGSLWWSSLSYTQSPHNLIILHLGQLSGPQMVTAAIVAVNGLMAEAGMHYQHGRELGTRERGIGGEAEKVTLASPHPIVYLSLGIALLLVSHLIGFGLYSRPLIQPTETALKVGIIQGNIPNQIKLYPAGWRRAIEGYTTGYNNLADEGVQAVLTPETALPFIWEEQVRDRSSFYSAILNKGVLAWVGALGQEGSTLSVAEEGSTLSVAEGLGFTNSLFTVSGTGKTLSRYNKVKLVPLGEYIPFEPVVGRLINRLSPLDAHLVAGKPAQIFETPWGRAIVGICYDSTFAEHFRRQAAKGGEFILTASNNAHYSETMPAQHHAQDVMRAIESDRWAVRATNTGYSGIIDPHGRTRWLSGINTYEIHADTVYRRQTQTLYVRWGDWLTSLLLGLAVLAITVMSLR